MMDALRLDSELQRGPAGKARISRDAACRERPSGDIRVTEQEIESKVIDIVAEQMGADKAKITRDTSFTEDLNADSLDTVELVMEFEDEFDMSIPDDQAEQIKTVGLAINFIKQNNGLD